MFRCQSPDRTSVGKTLLYDCMMHKASKTELNDKLQSYVSMKKYIHVENGLCSKVTPGKILSKSSPVCICLSRWLGSTTTIQAGRGVQAVHVTGASTIFFHFVRSPR